MSDILSETEGCNLLARLFKSRGYTIARNVPFREYGVSFHIDGWDAKARVGFEFLTSEDEDHDDLSLGEFKTLMMAQQRGELSVFVIDEFEPLSAADLAAAANTFLDEVADAKKAGRRIAPARKKAASQKKVPAQKKAATTQRTAGTKSSPVVKKTAAKKPTRRK
ncbi:MAG: hypothetical protein WCJ18_10205 [Planctomycetota bacterium]